MTHTDILPPPPLFRLFPGVAHPYLYLMRLDRPIGTWLLLLPGWWAIALARPAWGQGIWLAALFALGAVVMRGAGCVVNDLWDRDFDRRVTRTATRPLACGAISPQRALLFTVGLCLIGLAVLTQMNGPAIWVGVASLPLIVIYPLMKRVTWWPQAFLGLTFNWGALVGCAAVTGTITPQTFWLYIAGFFWTLGYDTIYAHQDKIDDAAIGVKSTALRLGDRSFVWIMIWYSLTVMCLAVAGWAAHLEGGFWILLIAPALHLTWQVRRLRVDDPALCLSLFRSNRDAGLLVLLAILAGLAG
jgi:4-hydroxybenzoate polyprenyltransferase